MILPALKELREVLAMTDPAFRLAAGERWISRWVETAQSVSDIDALMFDALGAIEGGTCRAVSDAKMLELLVRGMVERGRPGERHGLEDLGLTEVQDDGGAFKVYRTRLSATIIRAKPRHP